MLADQYRIERRLGAPGAAGSTYLATDLLADAARVLKLITRERGSARERLEREYRALAALPAHPRLRRALFASRLGGDGPFFLVSEYLAGEPLDAVLERGTLTLAECLQAMLDVAEALGFLHEHGVAHGDVQARNIVWTEDGAVLIDFNAAERGGDGGAALHGSVRERDWAHFSALLRAALTTGAAEAAAEPRPGELARYLGEEPIDFTGLGQAASVLGGALARLRPADAAPASVGAAFDAPEVWAEYDAHVRVFAGRERFLERIAQWEQRASAGEYLLVLGPPGQGKSALMAELARRHRLSRPDDAGQGGEAGGAPALLHMIKSYRDPRRLLLALIAQAARLSGDAPWAESAEGEIDELRNELLARLERLRTLHGRVVVLIDALDELTSDGKRLEFLPQDLPEGVRVILSSRPDVPLVQALKRRLRRLTTEDLPPLAPEDLPLFLERYLEPTRVRQLESVVDFPEVARRAGHAPLMLRRALEVILASAQGPGEIDAGAVQHAVEGLPATLEELFERIYDEIAEKEDGSFTSEAGRIRAQVVRVLALAREPLAAEQVRGVLHAAGRALDLEEVGDALRRASPYLLTFPGRRYLLFHQGLADYVVAHVLGAEGTLDLHLAFAQHLERPRERATLYALRHRAAHLRAGVLAALELGESDVQRDAAHRLTEGLTAWETIQAALDSGVRAELRAEMEQALDPALGIAREGARTLVEWTGFLDRRASLLRRMPELLLQSALAEPAESAVRRAADRQRDHARAPYLEPVHAPEDAAPSRLLRVLYDERHAPRRVRFAPCGNYLASAAPGAIRLWEVATGRVVREIAVHESNDVFTFVDGTRLAAIDEAGRLALFDWTDGRALWSSDVGDARIEQLRVMTVTGRRDSLPVALFTLDMDTRVGMMMLGSTEDEHSIVGGPYTDRDAYYAFAVGPWLLYVIAYYEGVEVHTKLFRWVVPGFLRTHHTEAEVEQMLAADPQLFGEDAEDVQWVDYIESIDEMEYLDGLRWAALNSSGLHEFGLDHSRERGFREFSSGYAGSGSTLRVSGDARRLLLASRRLVLIDTESWETIAELPEATPYRSGLDVDLSLDAARVAQIDRVGQIMIWDASPGRAEFPGTIFALSDIQADDTRTEWIVRGFLPYQDRHTAFRYDTGTGMFHRIGASEFPPDAHPVLGGNAEPALLRCRDGELRVVRLEDGTPLNRIPVPAEADWVIAISSGRRWALLRGNYANRHRGWRLDLQNERVHELPVPVPEYGPAIVMNDGTVVSAGLASQDHAGKLLCAARPDGTVRQIELVECGTVCSLALAGAQRAAVASDDGMVQIWDLPLERLVRVVQVSVPNARDMSLSARTAAV